jgi:enoyl-CoA hydratase/carnithine racemase
LGENVVLYRTEEGVGIITLNRPERLNAINHDLLRGLIGTLETAKADATVASVVLTGAGRAFCAGEDLKETAQGKNAIQWCREIDALQDVQRVILGFGKPLIAAICGYALGGGLEFAMSCDIRIAARNAVMGFPETGVGLTVTTAGTKLITQIVGLGKAKELIFTGDFIGADEAQAMGLVNAVVDEAELMPSALAFCQKINRRSPLALKLSRIAIDQGMHSSFEQILELEASHLLSCVDSHEQRQLVDQKLSQMKQNK